MQLFVCQIRKTIEGCPFIEVPGGKWSPGPRPLTFSPFHPQSLCPVFQWQSCHSCQTCTLAFHSDNSSSPLCQRHGHSKPDLVREDHSSEHLQESPLTNPKWEKDASSTLPTYPVGTLRDSHSPAHQERVHCDGIWFLHVSIQSVQSPGWWSGTALP